MFSNKCGAEVQESFEVDRLRKQSVNCSRMGVGQLACVSRPNPIKVADWLIAACHIKACHLKQRLGRGVAKGLTGARDCCASSKALLNVK